MLTGHRYFREYLHRMGKCLSPFCIYVKKEALDNAEHIFYSCCRWAESRIRLETGPINVMTKMMNSSESWNTVKLFVKHVLRRKKSDPDAVE